MPIDGLAPEKGGKAMDFLPAILDSPERRLLRLTVRDLLAELLPSERVTQIDSSGEFARDVWRALGQTGMLGLAVPEELGGSGGSVADSCAVTIEIARRLPSLAVDYVLCAMTAQMLCGHGSAAQREWLAGLTSGRLLCAYAMTEPGGGTDLLQLRTSAAEVSDGWQINGHKQWISLAGDADLLFVLARTDRPPPGRSRARGLSIVAVRRDQPAVTVRRIRLEAMRAAGTWEIFLQDARAPADALVGVRGAGFTMLRATLDVERILSAAISLGIGTSALEMTVRHASDRDAFGGPIGRFQAVQHPAADSLTELSAAALLVERAIGAFDSGSADASSWSAMAKLYSAEMAARVADRGMRVWGAMGMAAEGHMQLMFRDARLALFSPISNDMVRNVLGESLGLPRSY